MRKNYAAKNHADVLAMRQQMTRDWYAAGGVYVLVELSADNTHYIPRKILALDEALRDEGLGDRQSYRLLEAGDERPEIEATK